MQLFISDTYYICVNNNREAKALNSSFFTFLISLIKYRKIESLM